MESGIQFVVVALVILVGWMFWSLRGLTWQEKIDYFKTHDGLGILKGIVISLVVSALLVIIFSMVGCAPTNTKYGSFNNGGSVYAGLDYTNKESPMCETDGTDSHTTSNLGLKYHIYQSSDSKFKTNLKYTHHSCAFSPDEDGYDAGGVELEYKLW